MKARLERLAVSAVAVAAVTGAVFGLKQAAPVLSLGVLYLFAVLPVAVFYGLGWALAVSIASMLAFNFFFLPPLHTLALTDSGNWVALAVFVVTSVVVSELSTRARRRSFAAAEADALRRSDAAKTAVLHAVSHDLRSPLTAIRVAAGGLESGTLALDADDRAALLETIRLETARLERLVANLLDLSRLEAGVAPAHRELWPVDELVSRSLEALGADAARIEVALDGEAPLVRVDAAPARARARERARECAAVLLTRGSGRARREQHGRRRARDDRRPRSRSRLREPGTDLRALRARARRRGGDRPRPRDRPWVRRGKRLSALGGAPSGLRGVVHARAAVGRGPADARPMSGALVLVVDDEPQILRALQTNLRGAGYEVTTASTAREALSAAAMRPPDAVILDLVLPDGSGIDVCRELRSWSSAPVLVLSVVGDESREGRGARRRR